MIDVFQLPMALTNRVRSAWAGAVRRTRFDESGSVLPLSAVGLLVVLAAGGSAVDIGRIYLVQGQMQAAVDAAALAGARSFANKGSTDANRERQVDLYFRENFPDGYMGTDPVVPARTFDVVNEINVTTVTAELELPMTFMRIFGFDSRRLTAVASAELQPRPLEVMVVLDDTGSMQTKDVGGGTRMDATKAAMHTFINVLHSGSARREDLAMGFVTYNVTTNVGKILSDHGVAIEPMDGFTNVESYTGGASGRANPLGWMGCVQNDTTVRDVSNSPTTFEAGAWDITRTLPGEMTSAGMHPPVKPYLYAPAATLKNDKDTYSKTADDVSKYVPVHNQANTSDGRRNNHYLLSPGGDKTIGQRLANSPAYRKHFYDFYIGLNNGPATAGDDVITTPAGGYYDPAVGGDYKVQYARVPFIDDTTVWGQPNAKYGYPLNSPTRTGHTLRMPSPNFQCPEPAMMIAYGQSKTAYENYVDYDNYPVMPASGTLHHIGLLWGYRILTRYDVFRRTNPYPDQTPIRALVFMTDGETSVSGDPIWSGAYGRLAEKRLANSTSAGTFQNQIMYRFAKVCEAAKRDDIDVYIVSLKADNSTFRTCAGARYYFTTDKKTINDAFAQIAVDLVDLHLTR